MEVDVDAQGDVTDYEFHLGDETEAESRHGADSTVQPKPPVCFAIFDEDAMSTANYNHPACVLEADQHLKKFKLPKFRPTPRKDPVLDAGRLISSTLHWLPLPPDKRPYRGSSCDVTRFTTSWS
jgi:hypothetical protein